MKYIYYFNSLILILFTLSTFKAQADSDIQTNFKTPEEKILFSQKLRFYGRLYLKPNKRPFEKFCQLENGQATQYLNNKMQMAIKDPISAYHYGALRAFAPCVDKSYIKSTQYLSFASRRGITEASYLLGLLLLKSENNETALRYFQDASENMHPKASYNYALLSSNRFMNISKETVEYIRTASMSGNLKAQHDEAIAAIKLYLNGQKKMSKNEFLRLQNILDNVTERSKISTLSRLAQENSELLRDLIANNMSKQNIIMQAAHHQKNQNDNEENIKISKKAINYQRLENQGIDKFNDHLDLSDVNLVGTTY